MKLTRKSYFGFDENQNARMNCPPLFATTGRRIILQCTIFYIQMSQTANPIIQHTSNGNARINEWILINSDILINIVNDSNANAKLKINWVFRKEHNIIICLVVDIYMWRMGNRKLADSLETIPWKVYFKCNSNLRYKIKSQQSVVQRIMVWWLYCSRFQNSHLKWMAKHD